jgi:hypothetical protein
MPRPVPAPLRSALALALTALAACGDPVSGVYHTPGSSMGDAGASPFPATCQDIAEASPGAADSEQTLYLDHDPARPWTAYCHDLAGAPAEYLPLVETGPAHNYAQYTAGGAIKGSNVRTAYTRLRIDPRTRFVNIADQRFSSSTGMLMGPSDVPVTSMPYGVATNCGGKSGRGNIDLRGTRFAVTPDDFTLGGYLAHGDAVYASSNQVVELQGGGYCGWLVPLPGLNAPFNQNGDFQLSLAYLDQD